ncbi:unnamed protein product [Knipowitschia caucasica]
MDTLYLDNIDEYVYDQDKIVTYKWLSLTLGVHVNTAKRMLFHYLEHKRSHSSDSLHATYLLTGKTEDAGLSCQKVCVVREDQLEDAKSKLSVVGSVHVYSVHKALLRDSAPLFAVDYDIVKSHGHNCNRYSAIRCPAAVPMSNARLSESTETRPAPPPPTEIQKPQSKACPKPKGIMGAFASKPKPKTETKTETKPEPKTEAKPGTKPETKTEAKAEITEKPVSEPKAAKSKSALNFFGNKSTKKPVPEVKEESSSTEQRPPQAERDPRSKSKRVQESDSDEEVKEVKKKRRRRIRRPQDSSDEDEGAAVVPDSPPAAPPPQQEEQKDQEEEEQQQEERQEEEQASPDPVREDPEQRPKEDSSRSSKPRKRRRVLKSSTFVDEDGSIVTEKGYVSESYSEGEEEEVQTKPGPSALLHPGPKPGSKPGPKPGPKAQNEKKKGTSAKATKQASIMGFFNRK